MTPSLRIALFVAGAAGIIFVLLPALAHLPHLGGYPGPYGDTIMARVSHERHTTQGVAAITYDYRGFDTLGEEIMLFSAAAGVTMLLRPRKDESEGEEEDGAADFLPPPPSAAVVMVGTLLFPVGLVIGLSMIMHGHLTPGGGFQGGVLTASAFLFVYLTGELADFVRAAPEAVQDTAEAAGAAGFGFVGLAGFFFGGSFLLNFLPLGENDKLLSAGTIPLLNVAAGVEVCAGILLILAAFLRQALEIRRRART